MCSPGEVFRGWEAVPPVAHPVFQTALTQDPAGIVPGPGAPDPDQAAVLFCVDCSLLTVDIVYSFPKKKWNRPPKRRPTQKRRLKSTFPVEAACFSGLQVGLGGASIRNRKVQGGISFMFAFPKDNCSDTRIMTCQMHWRGVIVSERRKSRCFVNFLS